MADKWMLVMKKLRPNYVVKGIKYLKKNGWKAFLIRAVSSDFEVVPYKRWFKIHKANRATLLKQRESSEEKLLFSVIVPVYCTSEKFLKAMIESVQNQSYQRWELCIANGSPEETFATEILKRYSNKDDRIRVCQLEHNLGIAGNTNAALKMMQGDFAVFLDHDDFLEPDALYELALFVDKHPNADMIYTDEDKTDASGKEFFQPHFKPDFSLDLLRSNNYICHLLAVKKKLVQSSGGFKEDYEGAQDYDFIFRCVESATYIGHIPKVLYHWRAHETSTSERPESKAYAFQSGKRAIEAHLQRQGIVAEVVMRENPGFYQVTYALERTPKVSVIIPNKDQKEKLQLCIESIISITEYPDYEIIIIENNSTTKEVFAYYKQLEKDTRIRILKWEKPFNYSAINNFGATAAQGELLVLLNNDVEVLQKDWMQQLVGNCQRPEVGAVGVKLYYPDHTIQHAGTIVGLGGVAGHAFAGCTDEAGSYMHKASLQLNYSAVTAACMMLRREVFWEVGGLEEDLAVAFNDVDLCLKIREKGYLIVYNPDVKLYHYESATRGADDNPEKQARFQREISYIKEKWGDILKNGDPYYNPNLTLLAGDYSLRWGG